MFNVYPFEVRYEVIRGSGILAGQPVVCTIGVRDQSAAQAIIDDLSARTGPDQYRNFSIQTKR